MAETIRAGRFTVSVDYLLRLCFGFDKEHRLLAVRLKDDNIVSGKSELEILVAGPMMPEQLPGQFPSEVDVELTQEAGGFPKVTKVTPRSDRRRETTEKLLHREEPPLRKLQTETEEPPE